MPIGTETRPGVTAVCDSVRRPGRIGARRPKHQAWDPRWLAVPMPRASFSTFPASLCSQELDGITLRRHLGLEHGVASALAVALEASRRAPPR